MNLEQLQNELGSLACRDDLTAAQVAIYARAIVDEYEGVKLNDGLEGMETSARKSRYLNYRLDLVGRYELRHVRTYTL